MNPYLPVDKQNIDNIKIDDSEDETVEMNPEEVALLNEKDFVEDETEDPITHRERDYIPGLDDGEGPKMEGYDERL